jgi:hypothetical protein
MYIEIRPFIHLFHSFWHTISSLGFLAILSSIAFFCYDACPPPTYPTSCEFFLLSKVQYTTYRN